MRDFFTKQSRKIELSARKRAILIGATLVSVVSASALAVYAAQISVPVINLTVAAAAQPNCFEDSVIDVQSQFATDANSNNDLFVSRITITGVNPTCSGNFARLRFLDSGDTVLQEIVWQMETDDGVTSLTLVADGSSTSLSNVTTGNTRTNFPTSQTDPNGLALSETTPGSISEFSLTASITTIGETT